VLVERRSDASATVPACLAEDGRARRVLGVDVGGTSVKWSLVQGDTVERSGSIDTPRVDHHAVLGAVAQLARECEVPLAGIGIAVPGTVDTVARRSLVVPNLPGDWSGLAVADELERLTGVPVALLNDARAFGWAELVAGAARGASDALFVTLGTGVGGAIARAGTILVGDVDAIGEIGHVLVDPHGELCGCGGRGCLETVASASAIVAHLARTVATGHSPALRALTADGARPLTARAAAEAARAGDPWARDAFDRAGDAIGHAAAVVCLVLQLDLVVVGGGLAPAADLLLPRIESVLAQRRSLTGDVRTAVAQLGSTAGSVGAAIHASRTPAVHTTERNS